MYKFNIQSNCCQENVGKYDSAVLELMHLVALHHWLLQQLKRES